MSQSQPKSRSEIVVVGSMFLDLLYDRPPTRGSKPIRRSHGGVGRNISANLGWLGASVRLVTLSSPTPLGEEFATALRQAGVHLSAKPSRGGIGLWVGIQDENGEVTEHRFEMPRFEELDWPFVRRFLPGKPRHIVYESAINFEMVNELLAYAREHGILTYCVPTRLDTFGNQLARLRRADCLLMNREEAALVLETPLSSRREVLQAVVRLLELGVSEAFVTLGPEGVVAGRCGGPPVLFPQIPATMVVNTLGCGDAFVAGFVAARASGVGFVGAVKVGLQRARDTTATIEAVHAVPYDFNAASPT